MKSGLIGLSSVTLRIKILMFYSNLNQSGYRPVRRGGSLGANDPPPPPLRCHLNNDKATTVN